MAGVYIRSTNQWLEVTKAEHDDYYRGINAYRRTQQNHGRCTLPHKKYYYCDTNCSDCKYYVVDTESLDEVRTNRDGSEYTLHEFLPEENSNTEEIVADRLALELLLQRLEELMPEVIKIGEMRLMGMNDSAISKEMKIPRTTMLSRIQKLKTILAKEFPEFF